MVLENKHAEYVDDNPEYSNLPIHMQEPTHHVFLKIIYFLISPIHISRFKSC